MKGQTGEERTASQQTAIGSVVARLELVYESYDFILYFIYNT